jgi:hypothetical protein
MTNYPIYVITKGRHKSRLTIRALNCMKANFRIVVEPQELKEYSEVFSVDKIIVTPFSNLGQGSIPVRNFVWEHSMAEGHKRHWILDDNIEAFNRLHNNSKPEVYTDAIFRAAEDFTDRYSNVAISGFNYYSFCKSTEKVPPFYLNTRIYSCMLIDNSIPFRWRGKYNEDTDLSLRVLKDGYCTILFNAFLCGKVTTMRMTGGNTDTIYNTGDQRKEFAESLERQHPDCVRVVWKFNRWHHQVDYRKFKSNKLIRKDNTIYEGVNNYGMELKQVDRKAIKAGALHYSLQQTHGGQSVSQPAPNCEDATSPC